MKNFGDYIYIIVMVIAVVASLLKNKARQRTNAPQQPEDDDNELPTFDNWLNEARDERAQSTSLDEEESLEAEVATPKPSPFIRSDYFTYDAPDQAKPVRNLPTHQMELVEEDEGRFAIDPDLDIREAVIYAEILKRPQY